MICLALLALLLIRRGEYFSPDLVTIAIWVVIFILALVSRYHGYFFVDQLLAIVGWIFVFVIVGFITRKVDFEGSKVQYSIKSNFLFITVSALCSLYVLLYLREIVNYLGGDWLNLFFKLRQLAEEERQVVGPLIYVKNLLLISFYLELLNRQGKLYRKVIYCTLIITIAVLLMEKGYLIKLAIGFLFIYGGSFKVSVTKLFVVFFVLFYTSYLFNTLRFNSSYETYDTLGFVNIYVLSPTLLFQEAESNSSKETGFESFSFFYEVFNKVSPYEIASAEKRKPYDYVAGYRGNTHTALYPYYKDFGIKGVFIAALIISLFSFFIYEKSKTNDFYKVFYCFILYNLIFQFFQNEFSYSISNLLQVIIILVVVNFFNSNEPRCSKY